MCIFQSEHGCFYDECAFFKVDVGVFKEAVAFLRWMCTSQGGCGCSYDRFEFLKVNVGVLKVGVHLSGWVWVFL